MNDTQRITTEFTKAENKTKYVIDDEISDKGNNTNVIIICIVLSLILIGILHFFFHPAPKHKKNKDADKSLKKNVIEQAELKITTSAGSTLSGGENTHIKMENSNLMQKESLNINSSEMFDKKGKAIKNKKEKKKEKKKGKSVSCHNIDSAAGLGEDNMAVQAFTAMFGEFNDDKTQAVSNDQDFL